MLETGLKIDKWSIIAKPYLLLVGPVLEFVCCSYFVVFHKVDVPLVSLHKIHVPIKIIKTVKFSFENSALKLRPEIHRQLSIHNFIVSSFNYTSDGDFNFVPRRFNVTLPVV